MDVRIFSKCYFTTLGLRKIFSTIPTIYIRATDRVGLTHQEKRKCIFIIDSSSEGFSEYYHFMKMHLGETSSVFIIMNNVTHSPICLDEKTLVISKSTSLDYFYRILYYTQPDNRSRFRPVKLSKAEWTVFRYWSSGYSSEKITEITGIKKKSVLNSKARLLSKYGVHDKISLLTIAKILSH